jgi:hypothetical protein
LFVGALLAAASEPYPEHVARGAATLFFAHTDRARAGTDTQVIRVLDATLPPVGDHRYSPDVVLRLGAAAAAAGGYRPPVGAAAFAAGLVAAAEAGATGAELLTAFALGCETELRIAAALRVSRADRSWDVWCTAGVVAAAVAASLVAGGHEAQVRNAIGIAGAQVLGRTQARRTTLGAFLLGKAAANGYSASVLARGGFTGPQRIFDAERGYLHLLCDEPDLSRLAFDPGGDWYLALFGSEDGAEPPAPRQLLAALVEASGE